MQQLEHNRIGDMPSRVGEMESSFFGSGVLLYTCQDGDYWRRVLGTVRETGLTAAATSLVNAAFEYSSRFPDEKSTAEAVTLTILSWTFYNGNTDLCRWSLRERGHLDSHLTRTDLDRIFASLPQSRLRQCANYLCSVVEARSN